MWQNESTKWIHFNDKMTFTLIETQPPASNRGGEGLGVGVFGGEWEGGGGKLGDSFFSHPILGRWG